MKAPRLKFEDLMAVDVTDAGVLKRNVVRLLLQHPQGIKYGDFSGAFCKLHGRPPQLALHGYSSLRYLLTDMRNVVALEKNPQTTIIRLAVGVTLNCWLNKGKEMQSLMDEETDFWSPPPFLDTDFSVSCSTPQTMGHKSFLAPAVVPIVDFLEGYRKGKNIRKKQKKKKKYPSYRKQKTKSPEDSLAILTNILDTQKSGMKVKNLQGLLLAMAGFDLEKFCIARGYKDTLEFLEHQMPKLNISYCDRRLECVVSKHAIPTEGQGNMKTQKKYQGSQEKTRKRQGKKKAQKKSQGSQGTTERQGKWKVHSLESKVEVTWKEIPKEEDPLLFLEMKQKEFAIRVRSLPEVKDENLRQIFSQKLAVFMSLPPVETDLKIDKIFRINSRAAKEKNLPRDVVIYFNKRYFRDEILQAHYRNKMQFEGKDLILMKELPHEIIRRRKHYGFLVDVLKEKNISFRWLLLEGLTFEFKGQQCKFTNVQEAQEFLNKNKDLQRS